jgi:glutathione peroxidase
LRTLIVLLTLCSVLLSAATVLDFIPLSIDGKPTPLATYRGKVLLIVNVASHSIFTPQYEGLQALYAKYRDQGFVILAFPSNDFGKEEPDGNDAIKQFVADKYKITFPVFAKISLAGEHVSPLYQYLTDKQADPATSGPIRWNFTKFLADRDGKIVQRFEPDVTPDSPELAAAIEKALRGEKNKHDGVAHARYPLNRRAHSVSLRYTEKSNRPCSHPVPCCTDGRDAKNPPNILHAVPVRYRSERRCRPALVHRRLVRLRRLGSLPVHG